MMKERFTLELMLMFIFISSVLYSNKLFSADESTMVKEELYISIDRNVYCVDEFLNFRIFNNSSDNIKKLEWSQVIYVEVITPEGRSVARGKFPYNEDGAFGNLFLSDHILSGNYYVRAYTKWMRNQSVSDYYYESIKIINPFNTKVLTPLFKEEVSEKIEIDTIRSKIEKIFKIDKNHFKVNEKATISISKETSKLNINDLCVSIVKKGSINEGTLKFYQNNPYSDKITFIPELSGVSVSGKVINSADSIPIPYAKVWITMQSTEILSKEVMCNNEGKFTIQLGVEYGKRNLFLYPNVANTNLIPTVLIENDFAYSKIRLPHVPFELNDEEYLKVKEMMINNQINCAYHPYTAYNDSVNSKIDSVDFFYGKPDFILNFNDFIDLPTIADYFKELIPKVRIKTLNNQKNFQITGPYPELSIYNPLVLVDMVKIGNIEDILSISPSIFDRIEVIEMPYLRGDISYGGIIHFISKEGDFAKIKFPDESVFVLYELLSHSNVESFSDKIGTNIPELKNTLYWNSNLKISVGNSVELTFNSGSEPGVYQLKVEGITKEGKPFIELFEINVD